MAANLLTNPSFEVDSNNNGLADGWIFTGGTSIISFVAGAHGLKAQRVQRSFTAGEANPFQVFYCDTTANGSFAPGDPITGTVYAKGVVEGCTFQLRITARTATNGLAGDVVSGVFALTTSPARYILTLPACPVNTTCANISVRIAGWGAGDSFDITIDAAKLAKESVASAFSPLANILYFGGSN